MEVCCDEDFWTGRATVQEVTQNTTEKAGTICMEGRAQVSVRRKTLTSMISSCSQEYHYSKNNLKNFKNERAKSRLEHKGQETKKEELTSLLRVYPFQIHQEVSAIEACSSEGQAKLEPSQS